MSGSQGQAVSAIGNGLQGLSLMNQGASIATQGADLQAAADIQGGQFEAQVATLGAGYSASVYRSYEKAVSDQTAYSLAVSQSNYERQQQTLGEQITTQMTHNQAQAGAMGTLGSKSYLAVADANLSSAEMQIINQRNVELANQNEMIYQGQLSETRLENQARGAEYSGQVQATEAIYNSQVRATLANYQGNVAAYQATSGAGQQIGNMIGNGLTLLQ